MSEGNYIRSGQVALAMSVLGVVVWLRVLAFLMKWTHAYATGNFELGDGSSPMVLIGIFSFVLLVAVGGIFVSARIWFDSKWGISWQAASLVASLLSLGAVAGH